MENYTTLPQMGFVEACKKACRDIVVFKGRSRRSEYWWTFLALVIVTCVATILSYFGTAGEILNNILTIIVAIIGISALFRRLHDTGHSGWYEGASIILGLAGVTLIACGIFSGSMSLEELTADPVSATSSLADSMTSSGMGMIVAGSVVLTAQVILNIVILVFTLMDSDPEPNKYGDSPKYQIVD